LFSVVREPKAMMPFVFSTVREYGRNARLQGVRCSPHVQAHLR
jgi:hypothetical protein